MMIRRLPLVSLGWSLFALVAACNSAGVGPRDVRAQRIAELNKIARNCGLPPSIMSLEGTDELHIKPAPNESYAKVDCLFADLKKANLPLKMGFVGNEAYQPEDKNASSH
jgi:hypothetical protein